MKRLNIILFLTLLSTVVFAQDLHIYYDLETQTPRYVIDSQVVLRPYVRKGASVILHIENYNNYLYDVVVEQENREIRLPSSASPSALSSLFPALGKNSTDFLSFTGGGNSRGLANLGGTGGDRGTGNPASYSSELGISSAQAKLLSELVETYNMSLAKIEKIDDDVSTKRNQVQSLVEGHQINAFIMQEIENIKYDPALKPAQIQKMSYDYMCKALNIKSIEGEAFNLDSLLRKGNTRSQLMTLLDQVKDKHDEYRVEKSKLTAAKESLSENFAGNFLANTRFVTTAVQSYEQVEEKEEDIAMLENNLLQLVREIPDVDIAKLGTLWRQYEAILSNSFTKNHRTLAEGDDLIFNIRFAPNTTGATKQIPAFQLAPIQVPVAGGFKVNASIGLAFGQLFDRPQSFFLRDSVIRAEDKDSFVPLIASFFHFYAQSKGTVSFGGNFGIGLPITGDNAGQSASFFLGPSLLIGRGERLVLNMGVMGTKVDRLAQGFEVGDRFRSEVDNVPTKSVYEMGYFLGLSFNVVGGGR